MPEVGPVQPTKPSRGGPEKVPQDGSLPVGETPASFKAHLLEQTDLPERDIFFGYEPKLGTAMRRGDWKMIIKEDNVQLFNLQKDPQETTDVADQYPEVTSSMKQAIDRFKTNVTPGS